MPKDTPVVQLYTPHAGQQLLHNSKKRFRVMACGRRWGKTLACCNEASKFALEHPETLVMWVAPTYRQTQIAFRLMAKALAPVIDGEANKSELRIPVITGSTIVFASAERYDNLRGEGVHFLIMDEVGQIDERAWTESLRPTLSDTNGRAIFISTPRGRNWFYTLFQMGTKGTKEYDPEWESFTFPTSSNPYIPRAEIVSVKKQIPEDVYRQEYLAEFLAESAGVFRNIDAVIDEMGMRDYDPTCQYILGWDVAKHEDFSVVTVFNTTTRRLDYWERFNKIDYLYQVEVVERIAQMFHANIIMDATGVGDPLEELLRARGLVVDFLKFTNVLKEQFIRHMALQFEQASFRMPRLPILVDEIRRYEYHFTPTGTIVYSAPAGRHDDCVVSLGLCLWKCREYGDISFSMSDLPEPAQHFPTVEYDDPFLKKRQEQMEHMMSFLRTPDMKVFSNGWLDKEAVK